MDKAKLSQYQYLKREINLLEKKMKEEDKEEIQHDKVQGSNIEFPYQFLNVNIEGHEDIQVRRKRLQEIYNIRKSRINKCENLKLEIETWIANIDDSVVRLVFDMRYLEGTSWRRISMSLGSYNESTARMIHDRYLKKA